MFNYFKYLIFCLRYPHAKDFIGEGIGITARAARSTRFWKHHLANSKAFMLRSVLETATSFPGKQSEKVSVAILGAGTLLDIPFDELLPYTSSIVLVDANPAAMPVLQAAATRAKRRHVPVSVLCLEVTGRFEKWTAYIKKNATRFRLRDNHQQIIADLKNIPAAPTSLDTYDVVISANLLSQIGVMWRDRLTTNTRCEEELLAEVIRETCLLLETEHATLLASIANKKIVLLSDKMFMFYRRDTAPFQCERALVIESVQTCLQDFVLGQNECWFWHVAPQGVEQPEYGVIHDVLAQEFLRKT